jgi:hypothetical protein
MEEEGVLDLTVNSYATTRRETEFGLILKTFLL